MFVEIEVQDSDRPAAVDGRVVVVMLESRAMPLRPILCIDLTLLARHELLYLRDAGYDVLSELARRGLMTIH